jgi:transcription antitermination factor NusB
VVNQNYPIEFANIVINKMDPRHQKRIKILQELYAYFFYPSQKKNFDKKTLNIISCQEKINRYINQFSVKFKVEKIAKVDLAILQLAVYELIIEKKEPSKAIIDEAIELAKEFGGERSYAFVNAILGKVYSFISDKSGKS